jgi:hypothetical protein
MPNEQSSTGFVAVPTAADTFTRIYLDTVPAGATRLRKIRGSLALDHGAGAISVRDAPVFRLQGNGLQEQSPHDYLGMFGGAAWVGVGGAVQENMTAKYDVDIPVSTGGTIDVQIDTLDEAITAGTVLAELTYDDQPAAAVNQMAQYVDSAGTTTVDVWANIGTITVPKTITAKDPVKIVKVCLGVAPDQGTTTGSLRTSSRFRMSGSGIGGGAGLHEFIGPTGAEADLTSGAKLNQAGTVWLDTDIPVNAGGLITVDHRYEIEVPTASTVAMGLVYA